MEIAHALSSMSLGAFTVPGIRAKMNLGQPDDPELRAVGQMLYSMLAVGKVAVPLGDLIMGHTPGRVVLDVRPEDWQNCHGSWRG